MCDFVFWLEEERQIRAAYKKSRHWTTCVLLWYFEHNVRTISHGLHVCSLPG